MNGRTRPVGSCLVLEPERGRTGSFQLRLPRGGFSYRIPPDHELEIKLARFADQPVAELTPVIGSAEVSIPTDARLTHGERNCKPAPRPLSVPAESLAAKARRAILSTPLLGAIIGALTWPISSIRPTVGLDPSWIAGLYMAAERGLDAGTQVVFTYGPLGFLGLPGLYEVGLGRLAFAWTALVQMALCIALLWASRRAFGLIPALLVTAFAAAMPVADPVLLAATVVGLAALLGEWSPRARLYLAVGAGILAGMQLLGALRAGPTLAVMGLAVVLGLPDRRRTVPALLGSLALAFAVFWFATGQGIGNLGDYAINTANVVSGYSESMGFPSPVTGGRRRR